MKVPLRFLEENVENPILKKMFSGMRENINNIQKVNKMEMIVENMEALAKKKFNKSYCELDWEKQVAIRQEIKGTQPEKIVIKEKFDVNTPLTEY
jgi:hypothetical protein